jgi:Rieske Fe-S protein
VKQQRRIFLKVLAAGPLVGCGVSAGSQEDVLTDGGGHAGNGAGGSGSSAPVGGSASGGNGSGGSGVSAAGSNSTGNIGNTGNGNTGGSFFTNGGANQGGNPFGSAGTSSSSGGNGNVGGSSTGAAGTQGSAGSSSGNLGLVYVGNVKDIALGSFQIVAGLFFMGRDANGIYAMSMQCTHKFCALVISGAILDCPCHHSHFDHDGKVLMGPATTPLPHFAVMIDGAGGITVDRYAVVPATTRTKV